MRWRGRQGGTRRAALRYLAEDAPSGYGDAGDRLVRAVRSTGVGVEYRGWSNGQDDRHLGVHPHSRDPYPTARAARSAPTVAHLVPEQLPAVRKKIRRGALISHTVWETDLLPAHWAGLLNSVDRIIVPTEWNRDVFLASGVTAPVVVVPHVACDPVPGDGGLPLELPDDVVVFYTIARWDQRKNPANVVRAYLDAFTADDPVTLVVKTSPLAQYPAPGRWGAASQIEGTTMLELARIVREYPRPARVHAEITDWSPARIAGLHARGDCYVSLAHGEGWGLGAFDAAAYGNPVVMTGWGGQLAFLEHDTSFLVDYDVLPVRHWEPRSYAPEQHWAVPQHDHAVEQLRAVAANLSGARRRAAPLRDKVLRDFAPERVAALLFDVAPELASAAGGHAPATASSSDSTTSARRSAPSSELVLVGLAVGPWQSTYDNWVEMAERYGYRYDVVGREVAEPFLAFATKWRILLDHFRRLPRAQLILHLDMNDAFVCASPEVTLERYRSYGVPFVVGAVDNPKRRGPWDVPGRLRFGNSGAFVGEAGVAADAFREGFELVKRRLAPGSSFGDQRVLLRYLELPENRGLATLDHRGVLVQNLAAAPTYEEYDLHRAALERSSDAPSSAVHFYGGNGSGYNAFADLYGLEPAPLEPSGRFARTIPAEQARRHPMRQVERHERGRIPRIAHFVFGLRPDPEPFHLVHYLAIASCMAMVDPDEVHVHCHHRPFGRYWDLIEPHVVVDEVEPVPAVFERRDVDPEVARYSYAHHADFVRLDVLSKYGGLYADLDTLFVAPLPDRVWSAPFVIGREADVPRDPGQPPRPALSNAVLMSMPNASFVEAWRAEIADALDGTWANHSCFLAQDLAVRLPDEVHVEPQRAFHAFEPTPEGIALMLERDASHLSGVLAMHLLAHLWWDEDRRDFSLVHAGMIDEDWIRGSPSTYARAARPFLPPP